MGGLGHHLSHPYGLQTLAFYLSLLFPGGVLLLLVGAAWEYARRNAFRRPEGRRARSSAVFARRLVSLKD